MKAYVNALIILAGLFSFCKCTSPQAKKGFNYPDVKIVSAMKNVMWKGELGGKIKLDTISNKNNLYGLGPLEGLQGEILINDGVSYIAKVNADKSMQVDTSFNVSAPFFVLAKVKQWQEIKLPDSILNIQHLETFIDKKTKSRKRPFAFKLKGRAKSAKIHVQNLPEGTVVTSPKEAHQGQVNYELQDQGVEIIGFFSTEHQGVFTHHDSYLHMHLITDDKAMMGHLDDIEMGEMQLYLPIK
jgi:acetolactate decarboxylase